MAKKTVNERYIPGDYFMACDRCGLSYRRSDLRRDGYKKGLMVCRSCWDFKPTYPSPPPDRIPVPTPRPDNTSVSANSTTYNNTFIGNNLFPDPWMEEANNSLWSTGYEISQDHVHSETTSRKITNASIFVSGLEVGKTYRIRVHAYLEDRPSSVIRINTIETNMFKSTPLNSWQQDDYYYTATIGTIEVSFSGNGGWFDTVYVQEYINEDVSLTNSEILENKKPPADISVDNTITPTPTYIEWGTTNIFPDPDVSTVPTDFTAFDISGPSVTVSRSTAQAKEGTHSLMTQRSGVGLCSGGAYINCDDLKESTTYRFRLWVYDETFAWDKYAGFGATGSTLPTQIITAHSALTWSQSDYFEFTTPSTLVNTNIYFGVKGVTVLSRYVEYFDSFELNEYINETTPF